ncbi:MAG: AI-2E family transporter [Steroidobacteraceae bacterium]
MPDSVNQGKSASAQPPRIPPAGAPGTSTLTGVVVAVVVVAALYVGREVLIPVTVALLLSFLLTPLVELLRRVWLGRVVSVLLAVILALGIIIAIGSAIGSQVARLGKQLPQYQTTIERKISSLRRETISHISGRLASLDHRLSSGGQPHPAPAAPLQANPQAPARTPIPVVVTQPTPSALSIGEKVILPVLSPIATAGIIFVVTIFTLLQKEDLRDRAIRLFGSGDLRTTTLAMNDAGRRLSRYFLTQLGINTSFGAILAAGLYFIGVPDPVLWGIVGGLLRFIPYIGSWIAALLSIALAAAVSPGWSMAIWTAVLYAGTELILGQAVEPLIYGHSTGLSPLAVIIAAIFWTWIWGPIGLIISTPITLCLVVLGRHTERLEIFDVLLGDRPALTAVESFYQRMLADDPDEALAQAEQYLEDRLLSSYYDEVVCQALQLATTDVARGALSAGKVERLKATIMALVDDLEGYEDAQPAPGGGKTTAGPTLDRESLPEDAPAVGPSLSPQEADAEPRRRGPLAVLCIAGRGPLDEAVATMLAQLLRKHGIGAQTQPYEAVSRTRVRSLRVQGVGMVCISYVNIEGNPAHLRYLLLRLRARLPRQVSLLVGLWPAKDPILNDANLRRLVGADHYVSSLRDAVEACIAESREHVRPPSGPA